MSGLGQVAAPGARTALAVEQAEDVPGDRLERGALRALALDIGQQPRDDLGATRRRLARAEQQALIRHQAVRVVVGLAPEHHAVDRGALQPGLLGRGDAAIDDHLERREVRLEAVHQLVAQGRDLPVLLGAEPGEPGLARMHDHGPAAPRCDAFDEGREKAIVVALVDADPGLDGDRQRARRPHRPHARRDALRLGHQAGAEPRALHAIARAADIEIDLVVARGRAERRRPGQLLRRAAAELQRYRMLGRIEAQQPLARPVQQRPGRDHLGIEQRTPRDQPQEIAAMAVRPVHHRRDRQASVQAVRHLSSLPDRCAAQSI
jgi:hypothetical protein